MAKNKSPDTGFIGWIPIPEDYQFVPLRHLNPDYVVGVNAQFPVYIGDGPGLRRQTQHNIVKHEFEKRLEAGEHLYPQPKRPDRSFGITDKCMFNFGYVSFDHVPRELPPGTIRVVCNYDNRANIYPDDELIVNIRTYIDPGGVSTCAINVIL